MLGYGAFGFGLYMTVGTLIKVVYSVLQGLGLLSLNSGNLVGCSWQLLLGRDLNYALIVTFVMNVKYWFRLM